MDFYLIPKKPLVQTKRQQQQPQGFFTTCPIARWERAFPPCIPTPLQQTSWTKISFLKLIDHQNTHRKFGNLQKCQKKNLLLHIRGADQNPKPLHPLRFTYHECISWLSLFIHNANWHELVFSKKECSISKKCIKVAEEKYCSRDEIKSHSSLKWVMEIEKSTDKQWGYLTQGSFSLAVFLFYSFSNYSPYLLIK